MTLDGGACILNYSRVVLTNCPKDFDLLFFKVGRGKGKQSEHVKNSERLIIGFWPLGQNPARAKTPGVRFGVDGKHFKNGAFLKQWHHYDHVISLTEFIKHKSKMTGDFCFFLISLPYCRRKTFEAFSELIPPFPSHFPAFSLIPGRETPEASLSVLIPSGEVTYC